MHLNLGWYVVARWSSGEPDTAPLAPSDVSDSARDCAQLPGRRAPVDVTPILDLPSRRDIVICHTVVTARHPAEPSPSCPPSWRSASRAAWEETWE